MKQHIAPEIDPHQLRDIARERNMLDRIGLRGNPVEGMSLRDWKDLSDEVREKAAQVTPDKTITH